MSTQGLEAVAERNALHPRFRWSLNELSGSLGDLGTLIPLVSALIYLNGLEPSGLLASFGILFIVNGLAFGLPVTLQPMKAIAAISISKGYGAGAIAAGGLLTGLTILAVSVTGLLGFVEKATPKPVVRGIQLTLGISLGVSGVKMLAGLPVVGLDSLLLAALSLAVIAVSLKRMIPSALILVLVGVGVAFSVNPALMSEVELRPWIPALTVPSLEDLQVGLELAFAQVPLTTANSLLATVAFLQSRFPWRPITIRRLGVSVGLMSISAPFIGGVGTCQGAGGVAGWYRFGARTGGSMIMFGLILAALGFAAGGFVTAVMRAFPLSILGVMLIFVGLELAYQSRDIVRSREGLLVAASVALVGYVFSLPVGLLVGLLAAYSLKYVKRLWGRVK